VAIGSGVLVAVVGLALYRLLSRQPESQPLAVG
jgi:hypothetical protein